MQYARKLFTNQNIELTKKKHTKYIIYALQRNKFTKITMMPRRIFEISKEPKIQMFSLFRWWLVLHLHATSGVWKRKRCELEKSVKKHSFLQNDYTVTNSIEIGEKLPKTWCFLQQQIFWQKKKTIIFLQIAQVRALGQASAGLALGSAFWHGSHTRFLNFLSF